MTPDDYFGEHLESKELFTAIAATISLIGDATIHTSKSQIAFRRKRNFAWVWMPGKYLKGRLAPLVLTLVFPMRNESPRWKEIVEPAPGRFTHHLELYSLGDIDDEVSTWLHAAWAAA